MVKEPHNWIRSFQRIIYAYYETHRRPFPWRETRDPYAVLVSEIMLQQTQTSRVREKYKMFLSAYPTFSSLAQGQLADVLELWQGLGYNRRALALKRTAELVTEHYGGNLPSDEDTLLGLPGIGPYTAAAVRVFAFGIPSPVIDTNVRSVYIYFFFDDTTKVSDKKLLSLIRETFDHDDPREWVYALMDYGVFLKSHLTNPTRNSTTYTKQSRFEGSNRQVRGRIVRLLLEGTQTMTGLVAGTVTDQDSVTKALETLTRDGIVACEGDRYMIVS
jgi:A/G-specific adenine glycosylase